jgi:hypothetical protein
MNLRRIEPRLLSAVICALAVSCVQAASYDEERNRIAAERAAANAKFADEQRECRKRFIVTSCEEAALTEQRATLARLHHEQTLLDETRRHDAAELRRNEIQEKAAAQAAAQAARASEPDAAPERERSHRAQPRPAAPLKQHEGSRLSSGARARHVPEGAGAASAADPAAVEKRNEEKFEANARAAKEHREAVEKRNAERAAKGKVAAPLPAPSAASAP